MVPVAIVLLAGLTICTAFASPHAQPPSSESVRGCRVTVFVNDPDPGGLNLRRAPDAESQIVTAIADGDAMLDVIGSSGKWLRVARVRGADGKVQFEGEAWAFAPLTAVRADRAVGLYAAPRQPGPVITTMPADAVGVIQACDAKWVRVRYGKSDGWMAPGSHCGNSVTTCV